MLTSTKSKRKKKDSMNLKEWNGVYMRESGGKKTKGKMMELSQRLKNFFK